MHLVHHIDMKMETTSLKFKICNLESMVLNFILFFKNSSYFELNSYTYKSMVLVFYFIGNMKRWLHFVVNDHQLLNIKNLKLRMTN